MSDLVLFSFSFHLGMVIDMVVASMFLSFGFQAFYFFHFRHGSSKWQPKINEDINDAD